MSVTIKLSDEAHPAVREAIGAPLAAYNTSKGVGTELMTRAEAEAASRGCHSAWLDTFEFQARGFHERLGYRCFGELSDYPPGFSRYFMKKRIGHVAI